MSHFAVLVVTSEYPSTSVLERILAPWHEFECTGRADQYVIDIDKTEEARSEFEAATERKYRDPDGVDHSPYEDRFYREWTKEELADRGEAPGGMGFGNGVSWNSKDWGDGRGYRSKVHFLPEGWAEVTIAPEESFAEWASDYHGWKIVTDESLIDREDEHKYGYILTTPDGEVIRCIDRTNPNAKWDWWTVGGRYSGRLAPGYDPEKDPENLETCFLCGGRGKRNDEIGSRQRLANPEFKCNGCDGDGKRAKFPSDWKDVGNIAQWGALDLSLLEKAKVSERRAIVDEMCAKSGLSAEDLETGYQAYRSANAIWRELPHPRPRGKDYGEWLLTHPNGELAAAYNAADTWSSIKTTDGQTVEQWIEAAPAISAYAAVIDGHWCASGEMGWFGTSTDENDDWQKQMEAILARIQPTDYVAFVDCHI